MQFSINLEAAKAVFKRISNKKLYYIFYKYLEIEFIRHILSIIVKWWWNRVKERW